MLGRLRQPILWISAGDAHVVVHEPVAFRTQLWDREQADARMPGGAPSMRARVR